ncbi:MAG: hypothetical protein JNL10_03165 [Verrucomicrobiales bacterium]|nr:hypothetical protein [Verrucomicrobiales bacterium]
MRAFKNASHPLIQNTMKAPIDLDAIAAATTDGLETVSPERRAQTIALRLYALLVRNKAAGFESTTQAEVAEKLDVSQSAVSRAGDRAEEALARFRRRDSNAESLFSHL